RDERQPDAELEPAEGVRARQIEAEAERDRIGERHLHGDVADDERPGLEGGHEAEGCADLGLLDLVESSGARGGREAGGGEVGAVRDERGLGGCNSGEKQRDAGDRQKASGNRPEVSRYQSPVSCIPFVLHFSRNPAAYTFAGSTCLNRSALTLSCAAWSTA